MMKREYLVVNVSHSSEDKIRFVSSNYRLILFDIRRDEFDAYLKKLVSDGWELTRVDSWNDGWDETYWFKHSRE